MKEETFYRMAHDVGLPCQHCGKKLNLLHVVSGEYLIHDGRPTKQCPHCKNDLPQLQHRTYGVPTSSRDRMVTRGYPVAKSAAHFSIHSFSKGSHESS